MQRVAQRATDDECLQDSAEMGFRMDVKLETVGPTAKPEATVHQAASFDLVLGIVSAPSLGASPPKIASISFTSCTKRSESFS